MAQPLPNGVYPTASVAYGDASSSGSYLYVAGSDGNLYKVPLDIYINSGSAVVVADISSIVGLAYMALNDAGSQLYISDCGDGSPGSVWSVNLNDGTLTQFVTGLSYPTGLAVYGGYLYVTTNTTSSETENQITLVQIDLNDSTSQTALSVGLVSTFFSQQMVVHNYEGNPYTGLYCYFLCNGFDIDLDILLTHITQVDLTGFNSSSTYTLNYLTIDTTLISNLSSVGTTLVYNPYAGDFLSFVYSTTTHDYVNYITQVDISNPSTPSLSSDNYIPAVSNLTKSIYSVAVDSSGNFIIDFYDSYQIYGLPNYLELTYTNLPAGTLTLPISSGGSIIEVNWGDTTINTSTSHTYSTSSTYTITVNASGITQLNQTLGTGAQYLTSCSSFGDIGLTNLSHAFDGCTNLTVAPYTLPLLSTVTNMSYLFQNASSFNQALGWTTYVSSVTDISNMFNGATSFNQDMNGWFFQNVTDMSNMFKGASAFNCGTQTQFYFTVNETTPINMSGMFQNAVAFNQPINYTAFITSAVTDMSNMFNGAILFNQYMNGFDVSNVTNMSGTFQGATAFNNSLSGWNVSKVTNMSYMFQNATKFNQSLSTWNISSVTNIIHMLDECGLSSTKYNSTLKGWSALSSPTVQSSLDFAGYGLVYSPDGESAHNTLATTPNLWSFYGDALKSTDAIEKDVPFDLTVNVTPNTFFISGHQYELYFNNVSFSNTVTYNGTSTTLPTFTNLSFTQYVYKAPIVLKDVTDPMNKLVITTYYLTTENPLILRYENMPSGFELILPLWLGFPNNPIGTIIKIDWGDGTITTDHSVTHTYGTSGPYNVTIKVYGYDFFLLRYLSPATGAQYLIRCDSFGEIGLTDLFGAFDQCINLTTVPNNLPLSTSVTSLNYTFQGASSFNQDISNWDVSNVQTFQNTFTFCKIFNQDISSWNVSNVYNMYRTFYGATAFNNGGVALSWGSKTSNLLTMYGTFEGAINFNQDISSWDVSKVTDMTGVFSGAMAFNNGGVTLSWTDVSSVQSMQYMFYGAQTFNNGETTNTGIRPLSWTTTTTKLTTTYGMFNGATSFNQSVSDWDLSKITTMYQMFYGALAFNNGGVPLTWTLNTTITDSINMSGMFQNAYSFNQYVSSWDVSRVTNMSNMFNTATSFNNGGTALSWTNTTNVTDMSYMFYGAVAFNQNISDWDVSNVTNMTLMFNNATLFDQNLGTWNISSVQNLEGMLDYTGLSVTNYNSTLNGWATLSRVSPLTFGGYGLVYSPTGQAAHNTIAATPWYFEADALVSTDTVIQGASFNFTINIRYLSGDYYLTYSGKTTDTVSSSGGTIPFTGLVFTENGSRLPLVLHSANNGGTYTYYLDVYSSTVVCFKEDTKILTDKGYIPIQDLRNGHLVKTLLDDYKPVFMIAKREIYHSALEERIKDQLYKCTNEKYPEIFEDLIVTGCHSVLVNNFKDDTQREATSKILGQIYVTDDKYRLPICLDEKAQVYEKEGKYTVYHIALENENYTWNYGIFANGLLVESCSKRYLKERAGMTIIE